MTFVEDKDKALKAIDYYTLVSKNAKLVLKVLIQFGEPVTAASIGQALNLSRQVIYPCLARLVKHGLVNKSKNETSSYYLFSLNKTRFLEIQDHYAKTYAISNKIK